MKILRFSITLISLIGFTACTINPVSQPAVQAGAPGASIAIPSLKTEMGDFILGSIHFVDEVNGVKPEPGKRLLLIELSRSDGSKLDAANFSLADFQKMVQSASGKIFIAGSDGSRSISTMAGWINAEEKPFVVGFQLPESAADYQLFWPGNDPIRLHPQK